MFTVDIDECASYPCANGNCSQHGIDFYNCSCDPGWSGVNCESTHAMLLQILHTEWFVNEFLFCLQSTLTSVTVHRATMEHATILSTSTTVLAIPDGTGRSVAVSNKHI